MALCDDLERWDGGGRFKWETMCIYIYIYTYIYIYAHIYIYTVVTDSH